MALARHLFLRASKSRWLARQLSSRAFARRAVRRFMPGEDLDSAMAAARALADDGIGSVLTQLGENVTTGAEAAAVREHYLQVLDRAREPALLAQISVKPTHLGPNANADTCLEAVRLLAARAAEVGSFVWIDMEESSFTDVTLDIFRHVRAERPNVGVCLQAYLRRTPADLDVLLPLEPAIRLVKGAYNEAATVAFSRKRDVDHTYLALATRLLEAAARGRVPTPVFGTHDMRLVGSIRERAAALGLAPRRYEFHLLYGIRRTDQRALAAQGETVRILVSYGSSWFPWYMRRLAERPANVWFAARSLLR